MSRARFDGLRILLVEDEALVAMMIEDALRDLGCDVVGPVPSVEKGLAIVSRERLDGAFLDVNLRGQPAYPIAEALRARGVPVVFVTGYGQAGLDGRFADAPVVSKPFPPGALEELVLRHMATRASPPG